MHPDNPTADRLTGGILFVLGIAMLVGGYMMDRLEIRQIHPASIPGLVPMGLGAAMAICALLLIVSARHQHPETDGTCNNPANAVKDGADGDIKPAVPGSLKNLCVTALLCVAYATGLVGRIPFMAATALFIFLFAIYFLWPSGESESEVAKGRLIILCVVYAGIFSIGISVLFQYGFLVRLP